MSRLVARLLLALLMLPTAGALYIFGIVICEGIFFNHEGLAFGLPSLLVLIYVVSYWFLLWRHSIKWTRQRIVVTIAISVCAAGIGVVAGLIGTVAIYSESFGIFIGTTFATLSWLVGTIFVWREDSAERMERLRMAGTETVTCLSCGYNLTGLKRTVCPECGAEPTVEELLAGQSSRDESELASGGMP